MAEMHALIAKRAGTAHARTRSMPEEAPPSPSADPYSKILRALEDAAFELDSTLTKSASNYEQLVEDMHQLVADNKSVRLIWSWIASMTLIGDFQKAAQISALMDETHTQRLGMDLLKKLNAEAYEETKAIFEEANEQLEQLWEDVQLPPEESWAALSNDLRNITVAKHDLHVENA
jgi:protein ECT2